MDFKKMKVAELNDFCKENGIELDGSEKKADIIQKIEALDNTEVSKDEVELDNQDDVEAPMEKAAEEVAEDAQENIEIKPVVEVETKSDGKVSARYKSKQKWVDLGDFDSKDSAMKVLRRKGAKVYEIK